MTMVQTVNSLTTPPNTGSTFRSRLFHYAIGLSIGCLMTALTDRLNTLLARVDVIRGRL